MSPPLFAFTGCHFNIARMQGHAANQLNVKGNHFPSQGVASHDDVAETAAGLLDHRKGLGHDLLETLGQLPIFDHRKFRAAVFSLS